MTLPISIDWTTCSTKVADTDIDKIASVPTLSCIPPLIVGFINWALIFAGIIAIFLAIYAGFKYINSGGDPKQADTARKTLMYTVFGLFLIFMSFFIVRFIGQVSGLEKDCYSMFGFSNCKSDSSSTPSPEPKPKPKPLTCNPNEQKKCSILNLICKCVPITCKCNVNGGTPEGDNGFTCDDGTGKPPNPLVYCSSSPREYCTDTSVRPAWPCKAY